MNIVIGTLVLMALAFWVWRKLETVARRDQAFQGLWRMIRMNLPRLVLALISAGLFAELLPESLVQAHLGDTSGLQGIAIGALLGVVTPGGAFVAFALAAGAVKAGAAEPAMVAYVTAWSLFSLTKVVAEELVFLGGRFILTRVAVSLPIPFLAGSLALLV